MAPKFRGNGDDWLDDEKSRAFRGPKKNPQKAPPARSVALPLDQANASVVEVFPKQCRIKLDSSQVEFLCSYRRAEVVGKSKEEARERTPVAVGDRVLVNQTSPSSGVIEGICERRNALIRPAPGREARGAEVQHQHHVLAANIDLIAMNYQ